MIHEEFVSEFCTQGPIARALGRSEQALSRLLRPKHTHTHTHRLCQAAAAYPDLAQPRSRLATHLGISVTACLTTIPMALSLRCMLCAGSTSDRERFDKQLMGSERQARSSGFLALGTATQDMGVN